MVRDLRRKVAYMIKINKNETIYTILRGVSRSGMTRYIDCYIIRDNDPIMISGQVAEALGRTYNVKNSRPMGIISHGCGMDMGFELVYAYSCKLFCQDKWNEENAYSLKQRWI